MNNKLILIWVGLSLAIIGMTEWSAYHQTTKLIGTSDLVTHTLEIIRDLEDLEGQVLDVESARRGYLITGDQIHYSRFHATAQKVFKLLVQLRHRAQNDPALQSSLEQLDPLISERIEQLNQSMVLRGHRGIDLPGQVKLTDEWNAQRQRIFQLLENIGKTQKQRLVQRYDERTKNVEQSLQDLVRGTLISFFILVTVLWLLSRENHARATVETSLQRANRTLKTLSESHQAMMRASDEADLLQEICCILVVEGGYRLAWVGRAMADEGKTVLPLAHCGVDGGYLQNLGLTWADTERGQGPFGTAVRTGQPCIIRDLRQEQFFAPWREEALKRGFASACAFPLGTGDQLWGALAIYAGDADAFDDEEVALLGELAHDLEYGIEVLRTRLEHQRAVQALQESEEQHRLLVDNLNHGLVMINPDGLITLVNPKLCEMLGYCQDELVGHRASYFLDQPNRDILKRQFIQGLRGEFESYEIELSRKSGEKIFTLVTPTPILDPEGLLQRFFAVVTDITDRRQAEAEAQRYLQAIRLLITGVEKLTQIRDPDAMAQEMCQLVVEAFETPLVWLGRIEGNGRLRPLSGAGEAVVALENLGMALDDPRVCQGPIGLAISTGEPVVVNDVNQDKEEAFLTAALGRNFRSLGVFPLMSDHQPFACLNIFADEPNFFTPSRLELLGALAGITAAAIENAQLSLKVEKHLKQLQVVRQIDLAISSSLDLRVTLDVFLDQLLAQLQVDAAAILLFNSQTQVLEFAAGRGFQSGFISQARVPLDKGCAGAVAAQGKPLYIPDLVVAHGDYARSQIFSEEGFVSYYGVPLLNKGEIKGVIEILHRTKFDANAEMLKTLEALAGHAAIAIYNASLYEELQRSLNELSLAYGATLEGWARALELRDFETKGHCQRVTELTVNLALAMGIDPQEIPHIYRGALLHDIGKIAVPDRILLKPGKLTPEEWVIMRQHPVYAYELLAPIAYLRPALDIPFCHHEQWDGRGYPMGLKGTDIPLAARIFAVVDVWDALGSDRPYRRAWSRDKIESYLREQAGKQFDPEVVEVFLEKILAKIDTAA